MTQMDLFPTHVDLRCVDRAANKYRFYSLSVQPTLFGDWILIKQWGRTGCPGKIRHEHHETVTTALPTDPLPLL